MTIGEDNPTALINNESSSIAGTSGFSVEGPTGGGAQDNDGWNNLVQGFPPVISSGQILAERWVDLHAKVVLGGGVDSNCRRI